jgi:hypothetical protein
VGNLLSIHAAINKISRAVNSGGFEIVEVREILGDLRRIEAKVRIACLYNVLLLVRCHIGRKRLRFRIGAYVIVLFALPGHNSSFR